MARPAACLALTHVMTTPQFRYERLAPCPTYAALLEQDAGDFVRETASIPRLAPDAPGAGLSLEEFSARYVLFAEVPARVYRSRNGHSEIIVPVDYAARLDAARERSKSGRAAARETARAGEDAPLLPSLADRVQPAHVDELLSRLPDRGSAIARIYILDETDPTDRWRAAALAKPDFRASASCNASTIWLWKLDYGDGRAGDVVNHEWGHQLQWRRADLDRLHKLAMELEPDFPHVSAEERWAGLVETLLNWLHDVLVLESMDCPIQTSIVGRAVGSILSKTRSPGCLHRELRARMDHISQTVEPIACRDLEAMLGSKDEGRKASATQLLHFLSRTDATRV
jgi:hypothetical protein